VSFKFFEKFLSNGMIKWGRILKFGGVMKEPKLISERSLSKKDIKVGRINRRYRRHGFGC
jgi:hypothetical protein